MAERMMKDSRIEWIGKIPNNWNMRRLRYLGSVSGGMSNKKPEDFEFGTPFINYKNVYKNMVLPEKVDEVVNATESDKEKYSVKYGDTLFTGSSETIEELGLSSTCLKEIKDSTFNGFTMRFRPHSFREYNPEFMKYYYRSEAVRTHLVAFDNSVTRTNLSQNKLKDIVVLMPPANEQARIADFLDKKVSEIDAVISKTKESIEEYKKLKQSIITEAVTKGLDPNIEMKDSGIEWVGDIPNHWTLGRIKNCFNVFSGATPKSDNASYWDGDIKWITPADFKTDDIYVSAGSRNISEDGYNSCGTTIVPEGSVIFSKRAPIGTVAISLNDLCTNQGCLSCVPFDNTDSKFFYYFFSVSTEQLNLFGTGTTFKEISYDNFINFRIAIPTKEEQRQIANYLDNQCSKYDFLISKKEQVITELELYKKSLIYEYVTGKKEVSALWQ